MNMVEKVAMAIEDNIKAAVPDGVTVDYEYAARAAIEAMREPTDEMVFAVQSSYARDDFTAMIDAALKEGKE